MNAWVCIHEKEIQDYARQIAERMQPGVPVFLYGPMGVGKSTLARAILRTLIPDLDHIPSPSFAMVIPYFSIRGPVWHMDLYRIEKEADIPPLGLSDMMAQDFCLIEWPQRLGCYMPEKHGAVFLDFVNQNTPEGPTDPEDLGLFAPWEHPERQSWRSLRLDF